MAFTGRLGTLNSKLGSIVLGTVDDFGAAAAGFQVHQLTSNRVRVLFGIRVLDDALDISKYSLSTIAPPGTAFVPSVREDSFYDETQRAVVVEFSDDLTFPAPYTLEVSRVTASIGEEIVRFSRNFNANVHAPPLAIGAYQSKNGCVDVVFDRSVGPFSAIAAFDIRDAAGGAPVPMSQLPWGVEGIPEDTLRVQLPAGTPTADSFVIDYSGVKDRSVNIGSGTVPLTLALYRSLSPGPLSLADLLQIRITRAVVVNVSSRREGYATVRVFFNGPTQDADNLANWSFFLPGLHQYAASGPLPVSSPDAVDLPTCITLANEEKLRLNAHVAYANAHGGDVSQDAVSAPNATNLPTLVTLMQALVPKVTAHLHRGPPFHTFRTPGAPSGTPSTLLDCIAFANAVKPLFNEHIAQDFPTEAVGLSASAISPVNDHSRIAVPDTVFDVRSEYTYYAEFRVACNAENDVLPIRCLGLVNAADGLTQTNPADPTGQVYATSAAGDITERMKTDVPELYVFGLAPDAYYSKIPALPGPVSPEESEDVFMMGADFVLPETGAMSLLGPQGPVDVRDAQLSATLPSVLWALNELIFSYSVHIGAPSSGGAVHLATDVVNTIADPGDYAALPVANFFARANSLKAKMNAHMASAVYHFQSGNFAVASPDADDVPSLISLVDEMRQVFLRHNASVGPHSAAGDKVLCAPLYDLVRAFPAEMAAGAGYSLSGDLRTRLTLVGSFFEQDFLPTGSTGAELIRPVRYSGLFVGLATRPSLASAVPRSGLVINEEGAFFLPDAIEVFFSKPMRLVPLDSSNLSVTGGSILQKAASWTSDVLASVNVAKMQAIPYSVVASGLTDSSGNPIYP